MSEVEGYWAGLISRLRKESGAGSYAELARDLEISPPKLADARRGRQELPSEVKVEILGRLGEPVTEDIYKSVYPSKIRAQLEAELGRVYDPESDRRVTRNFWVKCLDRLQKKLSGDSGSTGRRVTDVQIAASLGVSNSLISAARNGTGTLSPLAKFRILDSLGYMASRDVLCDLLPRKAAARIKKFESLRFVARGQNCTERESEEAD